MQPNQPRTLAANPFTSRPPADPVVLYELRPDSATFWRGVRFRALTMAPVLAIGVYRAVRHGGAAWAVLLYGGFAALLVVGCQIMVQTSGIVLTASTIERRRMFLPARVIDRSATTGGVLVPQYRSAFNRTAPLLVILGRNGRALLRITGQVFDAAALTALTQQIGLQYFDVIGGVVGPKAISRRHKKIVPLWERRPLLVTVLGMIALLVLIVVGITIFDPVAS